MSRRGRVVVMPVVVGLPAIQRLRSRWGWVAQGVEVVVAERNGEVQRKRRERQRRAIPDLRSKPPHDARTISERSPERHVML
jgi:hypothetical protein